MADMVIFDTDTGKRVFRCHAGGDGGPTYGEALAIIAVARGDMAVARTDIAYCAEDGSVGRLATYVLPDKFVGVDDRAYSWEGDAYKSVKAWGRSQ